MFALTSQILLAACLCSASASIRRHRSSPLYPPDVSYYQGLSSPGGCIYGDPAPSYSYVEKLQPLRSYASSPLLHRSPLRHLETSGSLNSLGAPLTLGGPISYGPGLSGSICGPLGTIISGQIGCGGLGGSIIGPLGGGISGSIGHPAPLPHHDPCSTRYY